MIGGVEHGLNHLPAGQIRTYNGKAIFSQYSASDGGWTTDGGAPYLVAQPDPYDGLSGSSSHTRLVAIRRIRVPRVNRSAAPSRVRSDSRWPGMRLWRWSSGRRGSARPRSPGPGWVDARKPGHHAADPGDGFRDRGRHHTSLINDSNDAHDRTHWNSDAQICPTQVADRGYPICPAGDFPILWEQATGQV